MDILNTIFSLFSDEDMGGKFSPLIKLLKENSFDIKKTISSIKPEMILPLIKEFISKGDLHNNSNHTFTFEDGTSPIKKVADDKIIATLNLYFNNEN